MTAARATKPRPTSTHVWLVPSNARRGERRATLHKYIATRRVRVDGEAAWEHVYKCTDSGAERRFGLDEVGGLTSSEDEETN